MYCIRSPYENENTEKSPKSPPRTMLQQLKGISATPTICPPGSGGPASIVMVAGVHIYVRGKVPEGTMVTKSEGPSTLMHGSTVTTLPPKETPTAYAGSGASKSTEMAHTNTPRKKAPIRTVYDTKLLLYLER